MKKMLWYVPNCISPLSNRHGLAGAQQQVLEVRVTVGRFIRVHVDRADFKVVVAVRARAGGRSFSRKAAISSSSSGSFSLIFTAAVVCLE